MHIYVLSETKVKVGGLEVCFKKNSSVQLVRKTNTGDVIYI